MLNSSTLNLSALLEIYAFLQGEQNNSSDRASQTLSSIADDVFIGKKWCIALCCIIALYEMNQ